VTASAAVVVDQGEGFAEDQAADVVALQERAWEPELEAGGGSEPRKQLGFQLEVQAAEVGAELLGAAGADDRHDRAAEVLLPYPVDGHLGGRAAEPLGHREDLACQVVDPRADILGP
jgi:hypothetical protein